MKLTPDQQHAYDVVTRWARDTHNDARILAIVGPAGTGKTSLVTALLDGIREEPVYLTATTGKAARRLSEATNVPQDYVRTFHALMYGGADDRTGELVFADPQPAIPGIVLIDEASMLSPQVYEHIQDWAEKGTRFLLVGDGAQLPPIVSPQEAKSYGEDFTVFGECPRVELSTVMRAQGDILDAAQEVRQTQQLPTRSRGNYEYRQAHVKTAIDDWLADPEDHVLITWRNALRMQANRAIRIKLGKGDTILSSGEPIMFCRNSRRVTNGEIAFAASLAEGPTLAEVETSELRARRAGAKDDRTFGVRVSCTGRDTPMDGTMPWIKDWGAYKIALDRHHKKEFPDDYERFRPIEPVPITYAYALTAHKCVSPDTIVETSAGLQEICDIADAGMIAAPDGPREYADKVTLPEDDMVEIVTQDDNRLRVTLDHGVDVWDGERYVRRDARHVNVDDFVRVRLGVTMDAAKAPTLPQNIDVDVRARRFRLPTVLDNDVAEFLGLMVADGTVWDGGFRLAKRHTDVVDRFDALCRTLFDVVPRRYTIAETPAAEVHATHLVAWLRRVGGMDPNNKGVPKVVLRAPEAMQRAFLRGLFEDGYVNIRDGRVDHIELVSKFPRLIELTRIMLLRAGIISGSTPGAYDNIQIYGANAATFAKTIGFVAANKNARLTGDIPHETRYRIPVSPAEVAAWRTQTSADAHVWNNALTRGYISRHTATTLLRAHDIQVLRERTAFHHTQVKTLRPYRGASMCVTVPQGHQFLQNGFAGWNSQGSEYRRVTVFLSSRDIGNKFFFKKTMLPDGSSMKFAFRWLYTAMTRAREQLTVIVGPE